MSLLLGRATLTCHGHSGLRNSPSVKSGANVGFVGASPVIVRDQRILSPPDWWGHIPRMGLLGYGPSGTSTPFT